MKDLVEWWEKLTSLFIHAPWCSEGVGSKDGCFRTVIAWQPMLTVVSVASSSGLLLQIHCISIYIHWYTSGYKSHPPAIENDMHSTLGECVPSILPWENMSSNAPAQKKCKYSDCVREVAHSPCFWIYMGMEAIVFTTFWLTIYLAEALQATVTLWPLFNAHYLSISYNTCAYVEVALLFWCLSWDW